MDNITEILTVPKAALEFVGRISLLAIPIQRVGLDPFLPTVSHVLDV